MSKPIQNVSKRLMQLMQETGDKQIDMARKTGIARGTLTKYVNGKMGMKQSRIEQIAKAYNVDPAWLLGFDVPRRKESNVVLTEKTKKEVEIQNRQQQRILSYAKMLGKLKDSDRVMIEGMIDRLAGGDSDAKR